MFHKHRYNGFTSINYVPPRANLKRVNGLEEDALLKSMYGMSTLTQECTKCGKARSYTVAGDATKNQG